MKKPNFNPSLHGLRGFSALSVFIYHIWAGALNDKFVPDFIPEAIGKALSSLNAGVDLFFMISGYLITSSLLKQGNVTLFFKHRIIRIYPAFLPILLLIFIMGPFAGYDYFNGVSLSGWFSLFLANLFFLPGIFPMQAALLVAWTLSYEAAFYIFCAGAFLVYRKWPEKWMPIAITITALFCCIFYPKALLFMIGAAVYFCLRKPQKQLLFLSQFSAFYMIAFLIGTYFLTQISEQSISIRLETHILLFVITTGLAFLLFSSVAQRAGGVAKIMGLRFFQFLGTISYSLYLWHTPIMFATKRIAMKLFASMGPDIVFLAFALSSLAISMPVAWVSYKIFEDYIPRYLQKKEYI